MYSQHSCTTAYSSLHLIFHILISYFVSGCCRTGLIVLGPLCLAVQFSAFVEQIFLELLIQMYDHFVRCTSYSSNKEKHQQVSLYVFEVFTLNSPYGS